MPNGTVIVRHDLTIAPGSLLDAVTSGDPASSPIVPATVIVRGNVFVGWGSVLFLGCSPVFACPTAVTHDRIDGNLTGRGALGVVVHSTHIGGNFSLIGGGGGVVGGVATGVCAGSFATTPPTPAPVPPLWASDPSLANGEGPGLPIPVYSDSEDNWVGGNMAVIGLRTCWFGALRNHVGGNAFFVGNQFGSPDAPEVISNATIDGNLACFANDPAVQFGDSGGTSNVVRGHAFGECGFKVQQPNPAPGSGTTGPLQSISVKASSLGSYTGTHTQTASTVVSQTPVGTNTLVVEGNTDTLAGTGLAGSVTEQVLATVHSDGSGPLVALDLCTCSFDSMSGTVEIEAKGYTSASGVTTGTFLVVTASGGLAGLSGYGTFTSSGEPTDVLSLNEHLAIT